MLNGVHCVHMIRMVPPLLHFEKEKPCLQDYTFRAATNDYFDNRLVGRLFFRLIRLNTITFFYWQKTHYSTFCSMSFKQTECYENIRCLIYYTTCHKEKRNILGICQNVLFDCNWVSEKRHYKVLYLSFIDNSNNYIIALEIAYYCY